MNAELSGLDKSSTGLDPNLAAALAYLLGFLTGILFLVIEKDSKFVRFHALQSTMVFLGDLRRDRLRQHPLGHPGDRLAHQSSAQFPARSRDADPLVVPHVQGLQR